MRKSPFRAFVGSIILSNTPFRLAYVHHIKERVKHLSAKQHKLLDDVEKLLLRHNTLKGKIRNIPYYLKNFKAIYTFDGKHLFT